MNISSECSFIFFHLVVLFDLNLLILHREVFTNFVLIVRSIDVLRSIHWIPELPVVLMTLASSNCMRHNSSYISCLSYLLLWRTKIHHWYIKFWKICKEIITIIMIRLDTFGSKRIISISNFTSVKILHTRPSYRRLLGWYLCSYDRTWACSSTFILLDVLFEFNSLRSLIWCQ